MTSLIVEERDPSEFFVAALRVSNTFVPMDSESGQVGMLVEYNANFREASRTALVGVDPENVTQRCAIETVTKVNVPFTIIKTDTGRQQAVAGV